MTNTAHSYIVVNLARSLLMLKLEQDSQKACT